MKVELNPEVISTLNLWQNGQKNECCLSERIKLLNEFIRYITDSSYLDSIEAELKLRKIEALIFLGVVYGVVFCFMKMRFE